MSVFYTGKGDKGKSCVGKTKVDKTGDGMEALGSLDELNSLIGIVKSLGGLNKFKGFQKILHQVQENLFIIQANVGNAVFGLPAQAGGNFKVPRFEKRKISETEEVIDDFERKIKPAKKFIISGSTPLSAWLDYLRAYSRRTERAVLRFNKKSRVSPEILAYLNRLSSLFFAMARMAAKQSGKKEGSPVYR